MTISDNKKTSEVQINDLFTKTGYYLSKNVCAR